MLNFRPRHLAWRLASLFLSFSALALAPFLPGSPLGSRVQIAQSSVTELQLTNFHLTDFTYPRRKTL